MGPHQTQDRYRALFEAAPDPLVAVDETGEVVDVNAAAETLLEAAGESLVGRQYPALHPPVDRGRVRATLDAAASDDDLRVKRAEVAVATDAGTEIGVSLAVSLVNRPDDPLLLVRLRDTATRDSRERYLRRYTTYLGRYHAITTGTDASFEEKLRELLDLVSTQFDFDAGVLWRVEGSRITVVEAHAPGYPVFADDAFDLPGTLAQRIHEADDAVQIPDESAADDVPDLVASRFGLTAGAILGLPIRVRDEPYGALCFYDDESREAVLPEAELTLVEFVAEWLSYELARRLRERELERQNERLEEFASIVSHDLRNPLNAAKGYLALGTESGDREDLEKADRALDRMDQLITDVLELARQGRTLGTKTTVDLGEVARRAWRTVETSDATLELDDVGTIAADEGRLIELLENLFRNAVEHGGSTVTVRVGALPDGFYVEDDGPGVDPADREVVFESGYTTSEDGTGFGLAIVHQIAEAHDWSVGLLEGADGGARFEFTVERV